MKSLYKNDQNIINFFIPVVKTVVNWATSLVTPDIFEVFCRVLGPQLREINLNMSGLLLRLKYIKNTQTIKKLTPRWKLFEKYQLFKKNYLSKPRICTLRGFTRSPPHVGTQVASLLFIWIQKMSKHIV